MWRTMIRGKKELEAGEGLVWGTVSCLVLFESLGFGGSCGPSSIYSLTMEGPVWAAKENGLYCVCGKEPSTGFRQGNDAVSCAY